MRMKGLFLLLAALLCVRANVAVGVETSVVVKNTTTIFKQSMFNMKSTVYIHKDLHGVCAITLVVIKTNLYITNWISNNILCANDCIYSYNTTAIGDCVYGQNETVINDCILSIIHNPSSQFCYIHEQPTQSIDYHALKIIEAIFLIFIISIILIILVLVAIFKK